MTYAKLLQKSNSSIYQLQGNVLECTIEQLRGNKVIIDMGMRSPLVCLRNELFWEASININTVNRCAANAMKSICVPEVHPIKRELGDCSLNLIQTSSKFSKPIHAALEKLNGLMLIGCSPSLRIYKVEHLVRSANSSNLASGLLNSPQSASCQWTVADRFSQESCGPPLIREGSKKALSKCFIGIEEKSFGPSILTNLRNSRQSTVFSGEMTYIIPKNLVFRAKRKFVWTELTKLWRSSVKNRIKGFILNSVNGGFAVAIAGYIAFLPKSLCLNKKVYLGQWRQFSIINMNPKIANIIVKEIRSFDLLARNKLVVPTNKRESKPRIQSRSKREAFFRASKNQ
jgi:hypothetical protein